MKRILVAVFALSTLFVFANCGANNNNNGNNASAAMAATCYMMETSSNSTMYSYATPIPVPGVATCNPASYSAYPGFTPITSNGAYYGTTGYNPYGTTGYNPYGTTGYGSSYIGTGTMPNCPTNQDIVYSPSMGLGCVSNTAILGNGQPIMYALSGGTQAFVTVSTFNPTLLQYQQQYTNTTGYGNTGYGYGGYNPYGTTGYNTGYAGGYAGQNIGLTSQGQVLRVCSQVELCPTGQNCRSPFGVNTTSQIGICYY